MSAAMSFLNTSRLRQTLSEAGVENPDEKIAEAEAELSKIIKRLIKESQPVIDEQYNAAEPFLKVYPEYDSKIFPAGLSTIWRKPGFWGMPGRRLSSRMEGDIS